MSEEQSLRELVNARLTAAAEEIFTLFERTIAGYKDELARSKEENQRKQQLLDSILSPTIKVERVDTDFPPGPDEPEEHHIKQEEEQPFPESTVMCIKREESPSPIQQRQTEHQEQTQKEDFSSECDVKCENTSDNDKNCVNPLSSVDSSEFKDNGDHNLQNQIRKNKSVPQICVFKIIGVLSGTDGGATSNKPQFVKICNSNEGAKSTEPEQALCKNNNSNLQSQMEKTTQERPFSCTVCMKTFRTQRSLIAHKSQHAKERSYSCLICKKVFSEKSNFQEHTRTHMDEKPFNCRVCNKTFSRHLIRHTRLDSGEKPFSCRICEKSFRCSSVVQIHMRSHTGERPYRCTHCSKTFARNHDLFIHTRTHTGEKPFSCSICERSFKRNSILQTHMRIHTGEKPFSCTLCDKAYTQRNSLDRHIRNHTGEKPFKCSLCKKSFAMNHDLTRHYRTQHKQEPNS